MSKDFDYIDVKSMWDEAGYTNESSFVADAEVERVVNILVDEINRLRVRVSELESK